MIGQANSLDKPPVEIARSPKVSIIIPAYNCAHFILETLRSVFRQNYDSYEIIIVDDGSTDDLVTVLQAYAAKIRYIKQANAGSAAARNTGLDLAKGDYIVFLDADDLLLPGKLKEQAAFLDLRPSLGMVHSGWILIDEKGRTIETVEPWQKAPQLDLKTWFLHKPIRMGAMMYRRLWLESIGGLDPTMRQSHDVDLMLRLSLAGCRVEWMYRPTMAYRYYGSSTIRRNARKQQGYVTRVITKFLAQPNIPEEIQEMGTRVRYYNLRWIGWHLYQSGHLATMASPFEQAFSYSPKPKEETAVEIAKRFVDYFLADGRDLQSVREIFPAIKEGGHFTEGKWQPIQRLLEWWLNGFPQTGEKSLDLSMNLWPVWQQFYGRENETGVSAEILLTWWVDVWWFYINQRQPSSPQAFRQFSYLSADTLIKMCQLCIVLRPEKIGITEIDCLWADLNEAGLITEEQDTAVTPLYLTILGQQVVGRDWQNAAHSLRRIAPLSFNHSGWQAWRRFGEAALSFNPLGLRRKPHLLIGSVPDFPELSLKTFIEVSRQVGWQISAVSVDKEALYPLSLSVADWLPGDVLLQLAQARPGDNGRYLRHLRIQREDFSHYRKLPLFEAVWQVVYFNSIADAALNRHLFALKYPVIIRVQKAEEGNLAEDDLTWLLSRATAVQCDTKAVQAWLATQESAPEKLYLVYPGVDTTFFTPRNHQPPSNVFRLIIAADMSWGQGLDYALMAVKHLIHNGTAVQVHLLGDGPDRERLHHTIHDLELETPVCWQTWVDQHTRRALYQEADIFLSGQLQDGLPSQILEAMACGLPVVTTDLPALRELITEGKEGCLVAPRNPARLAEALSHLHKNPEMMAQMRAAARQRVESDFTLAHLQKNVAQLLKAVN